MGFIRLLLAAAVVAGHSTPIFGFQFIGGDDAVHAFFILSGFYMSFILNEKYIQANESYRLYISNRFMRIYPAYWVILGLILVSSIVQHYYSVVINAFGHDYGQLTGLITFFHQMSPLTFAYIVLINVFIIGQDTLMFLGLSNSGSLFFTTNYALTYPQLHFFLLIPQAWALSLEILFYCIAPFIVRRNWKFVIVLMCVSLALRMVLIKFGFTYDPWVYRFFPTELLFFLLGNISYKIYANIKHKIVTRRNLVFAWVLLLVSTFAYKSSGLAQYSIIYFFSFAGLLPYVFLLSKNWKFDRYLGELAYPIYISHIFILYIIGAMSIPGLKGTGTNLFFATLLFSFLLYEGVIRKVDKMRQRRVTSIRYHI